MKSIVERGEACVSMTLFEGLRLARSGFESSITYRSVVVFGTATLVSDDVEKARVLDLFVDAVLPGRASEVRAMNDAERRLTMVVAVAIDEASAKLSSGRRTIPTRTSTYRCGPEWCPPESTTGRRFLTPTAPWPPGRYRCRRR